MKSRNLFLFGLAFSVTSTIGAADEDLSDKAQEMLKRAVSAMIEDPTTALSSFTEGTAGFKDGELYVYCFERDINGNMKAHGANKDLVGTMIKYARDDNGKSFIVDLLLEETKQGEFIKVTHRAPHPESKAWADKVSFYTSIGNQNCGVGYYK